MLQDPTTLLTGEAGGYVAGQIFFDAFQARFGVGTGGVVLMGIPAVAMFLCTMASITSNSRCAKYTLHVASHTASCR